MQFIVFAAFAIVLSVPTAGPPWNTVTDRTAIWLIVLAQVVAPAIVAAVYTRLVKRRLDREPSWLPSAQRLLAQGNAVLRFVMLLGLGGSLYFTDWSLVVRGWPLVERVYGLSELLMLAPFFLAVVATWIALYPSDSAVRRVALELRLWASVPARPVWTLRAYLSFMLRHHVLIIAVPMVPIVIANDFVNEYGHVIRRAVGIGWADQVVLVMIAGAVFLIAPVLLRYIWHTRPLPPSELRARLEGLCQRVGLGYREILVWESDGMVVNAAVMGILTPVRYILLSDGLLEMMDDEKIEAVFGHELGHIRHRHMQYYLLFAVLSMLVVGGITELVLWTWPVLLENRQMTQDYLQVLAMIMIVFVWFFGFGFVSRRFEWQADLFGARNVTPDPAPAGAFGQYSPPSAPVDPKLPAEARPVTAAGVSVFADALHRIAILNGIPPEARSWRHSSIANRIRLLKTYPSQPDSAETLERSVWTIKAVLVVGSVIGMAIAIWLYWPRTRFVPPRPMPRAMEQVEGRSYVAECSRCDAECSRCDMARPFQVRPRYEAISRSR